MFNGGKGVGSQAGRVLKGVEFLVYAVRRDLALRLQLLVGLYPTRAQLAGSVHVNSVGTRRGPSASWRARGDKSANRRVALAAIRN